METILSNNKLKILALIIGILLGLAIFIVPNINILGLIIGVTFVIYTFLYPHIGLYAITFIIPFVSLKRVSLLLSIVVLAFMVRTFIIDNKKLKKIPFSYSLVLFIIPFIFATLTSFNKRASIDVLIAFMIGIALIFLGINLINTKKKLYYLILVLIASSVLVSLYGLYQYKIGINIKSSWVDVKLNPDLKTRVYSTLENPNILAEYLILILPLSISIMWISKSKIKKTVHLGMILIQFLCLLLTFSRGGWVGFAFGMMIFALFIDKRLFILYFIVGLLAIALSPDVVMTRIVSIINVEDTSTSYRFPIMKATIEMIKDYWISGVGLGTKAFKAAYPNYMREGIIAAHSHNIYLQIIVETGIFGFLGFLSLVVNSIRGNLIIFAKGADNRFKIISIGLLSGLSGLLLHGLVEHIFFSTKIILAFFILLTIIFINYRLEFEKQ